MASVVSAAITRPWRRRLLLAAAASSALAAGATKAYHSATATPAPPHALFSATPFLPASQPAPKSTWRRAPPPPPTANRRRRRLASPLRQLTLRCVRGLEWLGTVAAPLEPACRAAQCVLGWAALCAGLTAPYRVQPGLEPVLPRWRTDADGALDDAAVQLVLVGETAPVILRLATAAVRAFIITASMAATERPPPSLSLRFSLLDMLPTSAGDHRRAARALIRAGRVWHRDADASLPPKTSLADDTERLSGEELALLDRLLDALCDVMELVLGVSTAPETRQRQSRLHIVPAVDITPPDYVAQDTDALTGLEEALSPPTSPLPDPRLQEELGVEEEAAATATAEVDIGEELATYWRCACYSLVDRLQRAYPEVPIALVETPTASATATTPSRKEDALVFVGFTRGALGLAILLHQAQPMRG